MTTASAAGGGIFTLALEGTSPAGWGEQHGETFKSAIAELYKIRLGLMLERTDLATEDNVLALAQKHLPILRDFDADSADELEGIARGCGLTPAQIVVVNHYTDLRDLSAKDLQDDPGGCSVLYSPPSRTLSQTWDMHGSATDYTAILEIPGRHPDIAPERACVFTIVGCVGMCGINGAGLAMTINNLNSNDATLGVVWPSLVRRALREESAAKALEVVNRAPIGSGHHYVMADGREFYGLTTSGRKKKLTQSGAHTAWVHTNHCTDDEMAETTKPITTSTTLARRAELDTLVERGVPTTPETIFAAFKPVEMERTKEEPNKVATCGAVVMEIDHKRMLGMRGLPSKSAPLTFSVE